MICNKDKLFGHNYIAGLCLDCGRSQESITRTHPNHITQAVKMVPKEVKGEQSEEKDLATEIWEWSGKKLNFGMIRSLIKRKGKEGVRMAYREVVIDGAKEPIKMFLYKIGQQKMVNLT